MVLDLSSYAGKYVALDVRTLKVLDAAENPDELLEKLKRKGIDLTQISIDYISTPEELPILEVIK